jgi:hypothetical protein
MTPKDEKMRTIKIMNLAKGAITLVCFLLSFGIGCEAAANSGADELQRKIADIALLNHQLEDRMRQAEAALEAVLNQQNSLADEVHLLIKSFNIKSFDDTRLNLRLRNDLELLRTIDAYRRAFEAKIRFYQTGRNKLTYLQQLVEDDARMVATLSDFQIDALTTQVSLVINQYLDDAHSIQIDLQNIDMASAQTIWDAVWSGKF